MAEEGVSPERIRLAHEVDLRFHRQTWEVSVPLAALDAASVDGLADAFRERYAALYGRGALAQGAGIDLVNCRLIASGAVPRPHDAPAALGPADAGAARRGARAAWMPGASGRAPVAVYDGERLAPGMTLVGPAVIDRRDTTILVPGGDRAFVDTAGSLVIEVGHQVGYGAR
jgi:N-methylhydantoinase A/oxoprolinase/acetone carboxylase beta subunit